MATQGKTLSITLPEQLVDYLDRGADGMGVSRSRYISTILLNWQEEKRGIMMKSDTEKKINGGK